MAYTPPAFVAAVDVPLLSSPPSTVTDFAFTDIQFYAYLVGVGDPSGSSDYSANVIANDYEYYNYLDNPGCAASGRGGHCTPPPPFIASAYTYSDNYTNVTQQPTLLDITYHFSGADLAGLPIAFVVSNPGSYTLTLTDDVTGAVIALGAPLTTDNYTLQYQTSSITSTQITLMATPIPNTVILMLSGILMLAASRQRRRFSGMNQI